MDQQPQGRNVSGADARRESMFLAPEGEAFTQRLLFESGKLAAGIMLGAALTFWLVGHAQSNDVPATPATRDAIDVGNAANSSSAAPVTGPLEFTPLSPPAPEPMPDTPQRDVYDDSQAGAR